MVGCKSGSLSLGLIACCAALGAHVSEASAGAGCACGLCSKSDAILASQSPINFRSSDLTLAPLAPLHFDYSTAADLGLVNNGSPEEESTVLSLAPLGSGVLSVGGTSYNLVNVHFHIGSEHTLNGEEFAMEMHMVHQDANGNLLVVGRWLELGEFNAALDPIFSNLPQSENVDSPFSVTDFDLTALLPDDLSTIRYSGSLTTSPFTEPVSWVFLTDVFELSESQISAFASLFPEGNRREVQDLNDRVVFTDNSSLIPGPAVFSAVSFGMLFATSRRRRVAAVG